MLVYGQSTLDQFTLDQLTDDQFTLDQLTDDQFTDDQFTLPQTGGCEPEKSAALARVPVLAVWVVVPLTAAKISKYPAPALAAV